VRGEVIERRIQEEHADIARRAAREHPPLATPGEAALAAHRHVADAGARQAGSREATPGET
jgi:hypothetical protein